MIARRRFLAGSAASAAASLSAAASPGFACGLAHVEGRRTAIADTFMPDEWLHAFETAARANGNVADAAFLKTLAPMRARALTAQAGEFLLVSLPAPGVEPFEHDLARRLAMVSNDRLAAAVRAGRGTIGGLASISSFDANAADEAKRAINGLGLVGLALGANRGMRLSNRRLWPLYDFAQSAGAPIYLPAAYSAVAGDAPYRAVGREGVIAGASSDSAAHASQLIFGGVLDAFPRLNVILGRLGEATPHWSRELALARAWIDPDAPHAPRRDIDDYFRSNIRLTTADITSRGVTDYCNAMVGKERLFRSGRA